MFPEGQINPTCVANSCVLAYSIGHYESVGYFYCSHSYYGRNLNCMPALKKLLFSDETNLLQYHLNHLHHLYLNLGRIIRPKLVAGCCYCFGFGSPRQGLHGLHLQLITNFVDFEGFISPEYSEER